MAHCNTFRKDFAIRYPAHGYALWEPDPGRACNPVNVGDVGFIREGTFHKLFNAIHPENSSNLRQSPHFPPRLRHRPSDDNTESDSCDFFHTKNISKKVHAHKSGVHGSKFDNLHVGFSCSDNRGALFYLPFPAQRKDVGTRGDFARWMVSNIDYCVRVASEFGTGTQMEDIILVTGCHLAKSWINVTFSKEDAHVKLGIRSSGNSEVYFREGDVDGGDVKFGPQGKDLTNDQCIFLRGYRVIRFSDGQLNREPGVNPFDAKVTGAGEYVEYTGDRDGAKDPIHALLKHIKNAARGCNMALVHDDDLECIKGAPEETLQKDALTEFLRKKAPKIYTSRCELLSSGSGARANVTIATLSEKVRDALHGTISDQSAEQPSSGSLETVRRREGANDRGAKQDTQLEHRQPRAATVQSSSLAADPRPSQVPKTAVVSESNEARLANNEDMSRPGPTSSSTSKQMNSQSSSLAAVPRPFQVPKTAVVPESSETRPEIHEDTSRPGPTSSTSKQMTRQSPSLAAASRPSPKTSVVPESNEARPAIREDMPRPGPILPSTSSQMSRKSSSIVVAPKSTSKTSTVLESNEARPGIHEDMPRPGPTSLSTSKPMSRQPSNLAEATRPSPKTSVVRLVPESNEASPAVHEDMSRPGPTSLTSKQMNKQSSSLAAAPRPSPSPQTSVVSDSNIARPAIHEDLPKSGQTLLSTSKQMSDQPHTEAAPRTPQKVPQTQEPQSTYGDSHSEPYASGGSRDKHRSSNAHADPREAQNVNSPGTARVHPAASAAPISRRTPSVAPTPLNGPGFSASSTLHEVPAKRRSDNEDISGSSHPPPQSSVNSRRTDQVRRTASVQPPTGSPSILPPPLDRRGISTFSSHDRDVNRTRPNNDSSGVTGANTASASDYPSRTWGSHPVDNRTTSPLPPASAGHPETSGHRDTNSHSTAPGTRPPRGQRLASADESGNQDSKRKYKVDPGQAPPPLTSISAESQQYNVRTGEPPSRQANSNDHSNYYPPLRPEHARTQTQTTQPSPRIPPLRTNTTPEGTAGIPITNGIIPLEPEPEPGRSWCCC